MSWWSPTRHSYGIVIIDEPVLELTPVQAIQARPPRCRLLFRKRKKSRNRFVSTTPNVEVAAAKTETDEEKVGQLMVELKGLNDDVQDKVLNGAFTGLEDF